MGAKKPVSSEMLKGTPGHGGIASIMHGCRYPRHCLGHPFSSELLKITGPIHRAQNSSLVESIVIGDEHGSECGRMGRDHHVQRC